MEKSHTQKKKSGRNILGGGQRNRQREREGDCMAEEKKDIAWKSRRWKRIYGK